ncbi:MAG TPA: site-specific integrase [Acidimicrobiales bacterium]|nr:site-specific integrase [Acidimicrobiales bacterium]
MRGSVTRQSKTSWRLRWDGGIDPETGRRRQFSKTVRGTKKQAEAVLNRLLGDPDNPAPERHTLAELVDAWFELTEPDLSPKTIEERRRTWRLHIEPTLGSMPLAQIRAHQLDALYSALRKQGKTQTAIKVHALLSGAFGQAVKWDWLASNPAARATPPRQPKVKVNVPNLDDVARALEACAAWADVGFDVLVRVMVLTGMRRGEACALRWADVDLENGSLHIHRSVVAVKGALIEKPTKTENDRRIAIGATAVALLAGHRLATAERLLKLGVGLGDGSYVFPADLDGTKPTHPSTVSHRWQRACRRAGVSGIRLHDLRHQSASHLIADGRDLRTVMERHGWTSLATAQRYIHAVEQKDREAAEALERILG